MNLTRPPSPKRRKRNRNSDNRTSSEIVDTVCYDADVAATDLGNESSDLNDDDDDDEWESDFSTSVEDDSSDDDYWS